LVSLDGICQIGGLYSASGFAFEERFIDFSIGIPRSTILLEFISFNSPLNDSQRFGNFPSA